MILFLLCKSWFFGTVLEGLLLQRRCLLEVVVEQTLACLEGSEPPLLHLLQHAIKSLVILQELQYQRVLRLVLRERGVTRVFEEGLD